MIQIGHFYLMVIPLIVYNLFILLISTLDLGNIPSWGQTLINRMHSSQSNRLATLTLLPQSSTDGSIGTFYRLDICSLNTIVDIDDFLRISEIIQGQRRDMSRIGIISYVLLIVRIVRLFFHFLRILTFSVCTHNENNDWSFVFRVFPHEFKIF